MKARLVTKTLGIGLFLVFVITSGIFAMDSRGITMDQAVEMALKNDSQVLNARNNVEKAKLGVQLEVIKTWPQASVTDSVFRDINSPNPNNFPNTFTVTITETVPTGFHLYGKSVPNNIEVAILEQINNEAQLKITEANTIYNTVSLFLSALKAKQTVDYQEAVVKSSQASLEIAREQLRQNKITKPDELKAENDWESASYTLEKNCSDYQLAVMQLGNQLGFKDISGLEIVAPPINQTTDTPDTAKIKEIAVKQRLEMKQAQISIQKAEQQLAQSMNKALPDLKFGYSFRSDDRTQSLALNYSFLSGDVTGDAQGNFGDQTHYDQGNNSNKMNALTLKLTWNLDFGIPQNQVKQNQLLLANAKNTSAQTKQGIEWDVEQAAAAYQLAIKKVEISRQAVPYYQKQLEIKRLQVKLGMASTTELASTENNLLQAQNQLKSDEYDRLLAYKKLQMASGELYPFQNQIR